jgi:hypothetical protein
MIIPDLEHQRGTADLLLDSHHGSDISFGNSWHELLDYTDALIRLVRDLKPRCRYTDRKEAMTFKTRIEALLPQEKG